MLQNQYKYIEYLDSNFHKISKNKSIKTETFISTINKLCFFKKPVSFIFSTKDHKGKLSFLAVPEPCMKNILTCNWCNNYFESDDIDKYCLKNIIIEDNGKIFISSPELEYADKKIIRVSLPSEFIEINMRNNIRHICNTAKVEIKKDGECILGKILDFNSDAFSVKFELSNDSSGSFCEPNTTVRAIIYSDNNEIFCGDCIVIRKTTYKNHFVAVFSNSSHNMPVQKPKKFRCERVKLIPSPYIRFKHEITQQNIILDINEISGSGFSVYEDENNSVLLPGMRIRSLELHFSNIYCIECSAKVINRRILNGNNEKKRIYICGLVFENMNMQDHTKLVSYLHQAKDQRTLICNSPDIDALWNFFFETGFVYPKKYQHIYSKQHTIKKNIEKIYIDNPEISRHFIFQDKGIIKGLIALQRVYKLTWMMHHLAARKDAVIAGPKVLSLIGSFINDSYNIESNRMKYAIIYYRKENKFPNLVFGGVARNVKNPSICSLDTFSYFHFQTAENVNNDVQHPWELARSTCNDINKLEIFYMQTSGGLMLKAFDLESKSIDDTEIYFAYERAGLNRERYLYTLKYKAMPIAVMMVHVTDIGINLSDLTNCIHVFIMDAESIDTDIFNSSLSYLVSKHYFGSAVVNLFPSTLSKKLSIKSEKEYTLWTYEMQHSDYYYEHLKKISRLLSIKE